MVRLVDRIEWRGRVPLRPSPPTGWRRVLRPPAPSGRPSVSLARGGRRQHGAPQHRPADGNARPPAAG
jgi:hypothetical protein